MLCQPKLKRVEANGPRRAPHYGSFRGKWIISLAPLLLAGCFDDEAGERQAGHGADNYPVIAEQINRTLKGDRLQASKVPAGRSLAEARAAALQVLRVEQHGEPLAKFYRALAGLSSGLQQEPVTILHLGDSHIAADNFTGDLREMFQARFGDAGRGMMMPGYPFPYYKARGVSFERKGSWKAANSFKNNPGTYGLSGVMLSTRSKGSRLALISKDGAFEYAEVAFLTQPKGGMAEVGFGGVQRSIKTSADKKRIKRIRIDRKGRELSVVSKGKGPVSILSWSVGQNRPGLRYINFGIPGATADTPARWDEALVQDGLSHLKPSLVVLGYGTNESFNDHLDPVAYEARVMGLAARLKKYAPQASLLILGPPDTARFPRYARARSKGAASSASCRTLSESEVQNYEKLKSSKSKQLARWHAPPKLGAVRVALERVAKAHGGQFWDWSQAMNGACGIHKWAKAKPPLAASDHVHMRSAGAKRSAAMLFNEVMAGYDAHVKLASR